MSIAHVARRQHARMAPDTAPHATLDRVIDESLEALSAARRDDGHWVFELEADVTIPAEYIMLEHFLDEIDETVESQLADYIRSLQGEHGGWPLFHGGALDVSASVKAYLALRLVGDDPAAAHMQRARTAILAKGGAETSNVFTLYALGLFEAVPWRAFPVMPVELVLQPAWSPFSIWRMSYWSRTVVVPLLIIAALRPVAQNPRGVAIDELFRTPPQVARYRHNPTGHPIGRLFLVLDRLLRPLERRVPRRLRAGALERAMAFIRPRLNGEDGLGAIFPAMANALMAMAALGYPPDHPERVTARRALDKLLTDDPKRRYCQPCVSPVWDTALSLHALTEATGRPDRAACRWLVERQITDCRGDWAVQRPAAIPGGWAFQYANAHYPDIDDTAVIGMVLHRADPDTYGEAIERALQWLLPLQSRSGGWAAFDADNTATYLNHIPFADHGALLDPPTVDVTAQVLGLLGQLGWRQGQPVVDRALRFLEREQEADGSWFGRWGTNYIYGTWSVLAGLNAVGVPAESPMVRRAVDWLELRQRADGGWGEDGATYWGEARNLAKASTPSQTAWALLGLMAAGEVESPAVARRVDFLLDQPRDAEGWVEPWYTAVGFPRVFYLRYHGYPRYFPLWALARYRNLKQRGRCDVPWGM